VRRRAPRRCHSVPLCFPHHATLCLQIRPHGSANILPLRPLSPSKSRTPVTVFPELTSLSASFEVASRGCCLPVLVVIRAEPPRRGLVPRPQGAVSCVSQEGAVRSSPAIARFPGLDLLFCVLQQLPPPPPHGSLRPPHIPAVVVDPSDHPFLRCSLATLVLDPSPPPDSEPSSLS